MQQTVLCGLNSKDHEPASEIGLQALALAQSWLLGQGFARMLLTRTYATLVACLLLASTAVAERPPHPEPRVIVNVIDVKGPHSPAAVQRSARFGWGRIVNCYKSTGNNAAGKLTAELLVSGAGRVTRARKTGSTLKSAELTSCLAQCLTGLSMPKADQNSTATLEIQVAPGDPP